MTKRVLIRPDGHCNPSGLELIEDLARKNRTQATIAVALGISKKKFETMISRAKGENEERLAWERGRADVEQRLLDVLTASALGELVEEDVLDEDGNPTGEKQTVRVQSKTGGIHAIFLAKSQHGWDEKGGGSNSTTNNDNRIQITIPAPMERGELLKALGQDKIADFRKDKSTPLIEPPIKTVNPKKEDDS